MLTKEEKEEREETFIRIAMGTYIHPYIARRLDTVEGPMVDVIQLMDNPNCFRGVFFCRQLNMYFDVRRCNDNNWIMTAYEAVRENESEETVRKKIPEETVRENKPEETVRKKEPEVPKSYNPLKSFFSKLIG